MMIQHIHHLYVAFCLCSAFHHFYMLPLPLLSISWADMVMARAYKQRLADQQERLHAQQQLQQQPPQASQAARPESISLISHERYSAPLPNRVEVPAGQTALAAGTNPAALAAAHQRISSVGH